MWSYLHISLLPTNWSLQSHWSTRVSVILFRFDAWSVSSTSTSKFQVSDHISSWSTSIAQSWSIYDWGSSRKFEFKISVMIEHWMFIDLYYILSQKCGIRIHIVIWHLLTHIRRLTEQFGKISSNNNSTLEVLQ